MKIYTKTGDKGTTRLVDGSCVEKHNPRVAAYGSVDELNSYLGVVISEIQKMNSITFISSCLEKIQHHLFRIGSLVATVDEKTFNSLPQIDDDRIHFLEHEIDSMTAELPQLKQFILPSGNSAIATTHFARTLCRKAERNISEVYSQSPEKLQNSLIYLNRLSDYLFTLARFISLKINSPEIAWDKNK